MGPNCDSNSRPPAVRVMYCPHCRAWSVRAFIAAARLRPCECDRCGQTSTPSSWQGPLSGGVTGRLLYSVARGFQNFGAYEIGQLVVIALVVFPAVNVILYVTRSVFLMARER